MQPNARYRMLGDELRVHALEPSQYCQHITENIYKKFSVQYKAPFWQIARAGSDQAFCEVLEHEPA
jgi:hypothetical protein